MRKRKKQIIAFLCALALCCGNDIIRVRADVLERAMPVAAQEVMPETTETEAPGNGISDIGREKDSAARLSTEEIELPENPAAIEENYSISLREGTKTGISMLTLRSISFQNCFGDQLDGLAREIYDVLVDTYVTQGKTGNIEDSFDTPVIFEAEVSEDSIVQNDAYNAACAEIEAALGSAFEGLTKDYPQVFWIDSLAIGYSIGAERSEESASGWNGIIRSYILRPVEYAEKYTEKIGEFNSSVAGAKSAVQTRLSEGASAYDTLRAIHDYLCEELEYNYDALSGDSAYQYAHNVYTAFAGNKKVVCEGYAKAFKILCNEFGIPCILATGDGVTSSDTEAHMWNCVKMEDGKWYAVDVTWDDQSTIRYEYFLAGGNTAGFNGSSFSTEHRLDSSFVYPELADENFVQCDHEWETIEEKTEATCTEEGSRTTKEVCKKCQIVKTGSEKTETVEALGHNYQETGTKAATCTEEGSRTKTCARCGDTVTEVIPKTEHSYGEWEVVKEAACAVDGTREHVCSVCGEKETGVIEAKGHNYGKWTLKQTAADAGNGVMERECAVCGEMQTEEIAADGTLISKELNTYHIIEGANSAWKGGSSAGIRIRVDGEYEKFQSVWVDGVLVGDNDYTAEKGSTIINLKTSYLETLPKGSHVIMVLYDDGQAGTVFSISEETAVSQVSPSESNSDHSSTVQNTNTAASGTQSINVQVIAPKTGDRVFLWLFALMILSGFAGVGMFLRKYANEE